MSILDTTDPRIMEAITDIKSEGVKLNPDFKEKWLEALRSDNYQQAQRALRSKTGYCCLGVSCDIADNGYWTDEPNGTSGLYEYVSRCVEADAYAQKRDGLPTDNVLAEMFDGPHSYTRIGKMRNACRALAGLNDEGYSFDVIADVIEETL